ncbi:lipopolysaccharide biosynthesis protein, partial [Thioclava sp. BHET1]
MALRRSFFYSFTDKYANLIIGVVTMALISRLLTPSEIGLFLVASATVVMVEELRDFGTGPCLVQAQAVTQGLVRTVFTIMVLLSALFGTLLYLLAPAIAAFFSEPALIPLFHTATLGFLVAPFSNPPLALLQREMAFRPIAVVSILAGGANACVTIGLAFAGFGPISLVWGSITAAVVTT